MNARNRSTKSGFIGPPSGELPLLHREGPHESHTVGRGDLLRVVEIVLIGFSIRRVAPHRDTVPGMGGHEPSIPSNTLSGSPARAVVAALAEVPGGDECRSMAHPTRVSSTD